MTSPLIELEDVEDVFLRYAVALCGTDVRVATGTTGDLLVAGGQRGEGWATPVHDGDAILVTLPARVNRFASRSANLAWYKVLFTHQAGHAEFGTLDGAPDFGDRDPDLIGAIFEAVEDSRIDWQVTARYPGIRRLYTLALGALLADRDPIGWLPPRLAVLEGVIQAGLGGQVFAEAPATVHPALREALACLRTVQAHGASRRTAVSAAKAIYDLIATLPALPVGADEHAGHDHDHGADEETGDRQARPRPDADDQFDAAARQADIDPAEVSPDEDHLRQEAAEAEESADLTPDVEAAGREAADGPLTRDGLFDRLYPEWDFRADEHRARWCRVRERVLPEGSADFYAQVLREHRGLITQVRARFENLAPRALHYVRGQRDGDEIDYDSLIQFVVDRIARAAPDERVYARKERAARDVAVLVLLDMSATTGEFVTAPAMKDIRPAGTGPDDYSRYLSQLAAGTDGDGRPLRKRIIDIEREAAILLGHALDAIGDSYALCAFSGSGRREVEVSVIKDFTEALDYKVTRRFDSVAPAHATRMGAAIRHAAYRLGQADARTRMLFLISDGRPYDRDYGQDEDDREYAIRDTRAALDEARRRGILPFCLTVDKYGDDYLKDMCDGVPYEVVDNVNDLPLRLLMIYPHLEDHSAARDLQ